MPHVRNVLRMVSFAFTVTHATYKMYTKLEWLVNHSLSFSQSVHTMYETFTKLEWLVTCVLSFSQSVFSMYETFTDYRPVWGWLRLTPIRSV